MSDLARLTIEIDSRDAQKAKDRLRGLERRGSRTEDRLRSFGQTSERVGRQLTMFLSAPILALGTQIARVGADFEREMTRINTLVGVSAGEVRAMEEDVIALARSTGRSSRELASAMFVVQSAGARGSVAMDVLERSASAAAIGLGDTADIARATTAVIQAYGSENIDAARATDILASTIRAGNLEASSLSPVIGRVLGLASQMGVSFEELGANVATFTRLGVGAEEAIVGIRGVLTTLLSPTTQAEEALRGVGMSFDDLRNRVRDRGLADTMIELVAAFEGNDAALARVIPNVRALANVLGTASAQGETYAEVLDQIRREHGLVDEALETTRDTASFQWDEAKAASEAAMLSLRNNVLPMYRELTTVIASTADRLAGMDEQTQANVVRWGLFLAALGPGIMILSRTARSIAAVTRATRALNAVLLANPWILLGTAIVGTAAILGGAYMQRSREAERRTQELTRGVREQTTAFKELRDSIAGMDATSVSDRYRQLIARQSELTENVEAMSRRYEGMELSSDFMSDMAKMGVSVSELNELEEENRLILHQKRRELDLVNRQIEIVLDRSRENLEVENEILRIKRDELLAQRDLTGAEEETLRKLNSKIEENNKILQSRREALEVERDVNKVIAERPRIREQFPEEDIASGLVEEYERQDRAIAEVNRRLRENFRIIRDSAEVFEDFDKNEEKIAAVEEALREMMRRGVEPNNAAVAELIEQYNELSAAGRKTGKDLENSITNVDRVARDLGFTFSSAFEDAIVEGRAFLDVLDAIYKDILRITTRVLVTEPFAAALTGSISSAFGGSTAAGGGGGAMSAPVSPSVSVSSAPVSVNVVNQASTANVEIQERRNASGGVEIQALIKENIESLANAGQLDRMMSRNYNIKRRGLIRG